MAGNEMQFLKAPKENLETWNKIWKLMIGSGAVSLIVLLLLGLIVL